MPQNAAGNLIEPPVSVPIAHKHSPFATEAAHHELEPPEIRFLS